MDFINTVQTFYAKSEISAIALFNINQNVKKGQLKRKDIINIYKYDNTLRGVNIKGENLLRYMEYMAGYYQTIEEGDVTIAFNPKYRAYDLDLFSGVNYDIDISQPVGSRIKNAKINGKPIDKNATYKLASNNYRFNQLVTNNYLTFDDVYYNSENDATSTIRDFIIKYIQEELNGVIDPVCDNNWKIIGLPKSFNDSETIERIKNGEIQIPFSDDGRTPNVSPVKLVQKNNLSKLSIPIIFIILFILLILCFIFK